MVCYDVGDRASFQRAAHSLMSFVVDRHLADTKTESVVPGRAVSAGFNGAWNKGVISGDKLTWRDGQESQIQMKDARVIGTKLNDRSYIGELRDDDKIYWSDGDIWLRHRVQRRPAVQLCGTKAYEENNFGISNDEVDEFVRANNLSTAAYTSAKTGDGIVNAFYDLAAAVLEADR